MLSTVSALALGSSGTVSVLAKAMALTSSEGHVCVYANEDSEPNEVDGYNVTSSSETYLEPVATGGIGGSADYGIIIPNIALHRYLNLAYVSDARTKDIAVMAITPSNCQLTLQKNYSIPGLDQSGMGLAISPNAKWLYVVNSQSKQIRLLDVKSNGTLSLVQQALTFSAIPYNVVVSDDSQTLLVAFFATHHLMSLSIDPTTGMLTQASDLLLNSNPQGIAIDAADHFIYVAESNDQMAQVEVLSLGADRSLTSVAVDTFSQGINTTGALLSNNGKYLYVTNPTSATILTLAVNPLDGSVTFSSSAKAGVAGFVQPMGLATIPSGKAVFIGDYAGGMIAYLGIFSSSPDGFLQSRGKFPVGQQLYFPNPQTVVARIYN